jgi:hypothetical protein
MSSPVEFFDVVYLGIFVILSRALNPQFYHPAETPQALDNEVASAELHFVSLILYFRTQYFTVLDRVLINPWYIIKRMLAEFAAAMVVFSQEIDEFQRGDMDMDVDGEEADEIPPSKVKVKVDDIMAQSYPEAMAYYLNCVATRHKQFTWTGPPVEIFPRSADDTFASLVLMPEKLDYPMRPIFTPDSSLPPSPLPVPAASNPSLLAAPTKRRGSANNDDLEAKKRRL